jgi:hypothetical protein
MPGAEVAQLALQGGDGTTGGLGTTFLFLDRLQASATHKVCACTYLMVNDVLLSCLKHRCQERRRTAKQRAS